MLYAVPVWRETPFFTPRERAAVAVVAINMWNRLALSTRTEPGSYQSNRAAA